MVLFFLKSFFIGVLAASGCGPLFVLTFNRSAICGFWRGFATALGASIGDSFYFMLGLLGALAVVKDIKYFMTFLNLIGGLVLLILGLYSIKKSKKVICSAIECSYSMFFSFLKAFVLTVINPLVILFFIAVTLQVLPDNIYNFSLSSVVLSTIFVALGSLFVLSIVSLIASYLGSCITARKLKVISIVTGGVFIAFGAFLLYSFSLEFAGFWR